MDQLLTASIAGALGIMGGTLLGCMFSQGAAADARRKIGMLSRQLEGALKAHARDRNRINRALACVTPKAAHVGRKMAKELRGDA